MTALALPAALNKSMSPWLGAAGASCTTTRLGSTSPALRLMSDALGRLTFAGYVTRNVAALGAIAVRLAITATTVVPDVIVGMPPCPATVISDATAVTTCSAHPGPPARVSQMRVGWIAGY